MQIKSTIFTTIATLLLTMGGQVTADYNTYQEIDESLFPCSWCINKGFIRGDLLYLRAFEDGLSNPFEPSFTETFQNSNEDDSLNFGVTRGHGREPKFRWDLGYRIGAGIDFVGCNWDIAAYWTHFSPSATKSSTERPRWKLDYDTIDLLIGYKCQLNRCFVIDAFGGLRGAQINQNIRGNFLTILRENQSSRGITSFARLNKKAKQDFEGIGFIFGLKGEFHFDCGLTFFLAGDAGTLVGRNKIHSHSEILFGSSNRFEIGFKRHQEACQYFVDSNIGIRWQTCIFDSLGLVLELAYETHNYFNHNRLNDEGNLYINGGALSAALQF